MKADEQICTVYINYIQLHRLFHADKVDNIITNLSEIAHITTRSVECYGGLMIHFSGMIWWTNDQFQWNAMVD